MICTFFGHRDSPSQLIPLIKETIIDLVENKGVNEFYVGNQGRFDKMVYRALRDVKRLYPDISYKVALAYMPKTKDNDDVIDYNDTVFLDSLEEVPARFAIDKRNRLLVDMADIVVVYVTYPGNADKFMRLAKRKGKQIINLADKEQK